PRRPAATDHLDLGDGRPVAHRGAVGRAALARGGRKGGEDRHRL
ncbi:MAG: hypothetical protein AVDCRST_MAG90-2176, partial [uncultured Microvirga sp.]